MEGPCCPGLKRFTWIMRRCRFKNILQEALYNMAPNDMYDDFGEPASENAQHSIFAVSKDMAKKFEKKTKTKKRAR